MFHPYIHSAFSQTLLIPVRAVGERARCTPIYGRRKESASTPVSKHASRSVSGLGEAKPGTQREATPTRTAQTRNVLEAPRCEPLALFHRERDDVFMRKPFYRSPV